MRLLHLRSVLLPVCLMGIGLAHAQVTDSSPHQAPLPPAANGDAPSEAVRPNIVFIITDDQDLHMDSLDYMPFVKQHIVDEGTFFRRHFCTTALCCPSRVSLLTGKLAHNTNVTNVVPPYGGYPKFIYEGLNDKYLPVWLQEAGYNTYYTGKLFNAHSTSNYNNPYAGGWNASSFLLDPFVYWYMNSTYSNNEGPIESFEGLYSVDVLANKSTALLDEAIKADRPFFLGIAPVAPHANIWAPGYKDGLGSNVSDVVFSPPVCAERHADLFEGVQVPRTDNFNPDKPSGGSWIRRLPQQTQENVDFNDHYYRQRLRALQSVDEIVDSVVKQLEANGIIDNTYIIYTTDNGYHIGQHRLQPSKQCSFEEDINIPFIVRGPNVPKNLVTDIITTHTDVAPTLLSIVGAPMRDDFDGVAIPLTADAIADAGRTRHEHVTVEHWGFASNEGTVYEGFQKMYFNNTYKAVRVYGGGGAYNLLYQVWCNNEHELYDMNTDPGQMVNLLLPEETPSAPARKLLGVPLEQLTTRLDALLFVLKSCKAEACVQPWKALFPAENVGNLQDALAERYDSFFAQRSGVEFNQCEMGYILESEGPQFGEDGADGPAFQIDANWHEFT